MTQIDLVNPWQRSECARLIRLYRTRGVALPVICATAHARRLARHASRLARRDATPQAYAFIAERLAEFSECKRA